MQLQPLPSFILPRRRIRRLEDLVGAAMHLGDEYAWADAGLLCDHYGWVQSSVLTTAVGAGLAPILRWTWEESFHHSGGRVMLISVRDLATPIDEVDLDIYRSAQRLADDWRVRLVDWVHSDGDDVRSFARLTGLPAPDQWAGPQ